MNEVVHNFKLVTGEEVLAIDVTPEGGDVFGVVPEKRRSVVLSKAVTIVARPGPQGVQIAFQEFMPFNGSEEVEVYLHAIVARARVKEDEEIYKGYCQAVLGHQIAVPDKKLVLPK